MEMAKLKLEQERLKIEEEERKEKLQLEQERLKIERIKTKEIEAKLKLEKDKLEKQGSSNSFTQSGFDATKNIRLVSKFEEKEVDKYFLHFEKIANSLKWPKESWTLLLQSVFIGKAREIYSSLSIEQCQSYDAVKKAVLKAYELVPEAYRQKFKSAKKESNQTHVEFARVQEQMFDGWLSSKNVNEGFKQLRQLVLIEQFKECIHANIKTHLDERDKNNLEDAATTADDYALTHRLSTNNMGGPNKFNQYHKGNSNRSNKDKSSQNQKSTKEGKHSQVPQVRETKVLQVQNQSSQGMVLSRDYCKLSGHNKTKCWKLMRKQLAAQQQSVSTGCAVSMRSKVSSQAVKDVESENIREDFEPFFLEGSVSLDSDKVDPKLIVTALLICKTLSMLKANKINE